MLERKAATRLRRYLLILAAQITFILVSGHFVVQWTAHAQTKKTRKTKGRIKKAAVAPK